MSVPAYSKPATNRSPHRARKEPYEIVFDRLLGKHRDDDERDVGASSIERSLRAAQPLIQRLHALIDNSAVLTMPAIGPIR